ncbi:uncharacterized protein LOC128673884 [Plodia interpunctella]|uniref:uncharacterized protein LOC128673884 n=1 Tax=Plodia interpunctella TaxID=58824 RepID=UPI0023679FC6|nr:uncharacterized protein LOC128673884 [Plodia interpunctella]
MNLIDDAQTMLLIIWAVLIVAALSLYFRQVYSRFSRHGVKHFRPVPMLGNMGNVTFRINHISNQIERLYNAFPNERFVGQYEFTNPMLLIRDIELVKKITIKDFEYFLNHRAFVDEVADPLFGRNLFSLKGQEWKDMRSTLSPAFTSSKIRLMLPFMVEVGNQMVLTLKNKIKQSGVGYTDLEGKDLTTRYANDVIASCAFGLKVNSHSDQDNEFYKMGKQASTFNYKQLMKFFGFVSFPKLMAILKVSLFSDESKNFFKNIVMSTMRDRETHNIIRPDMINILMEAKKGKLVHDVKTSEDADAGFATVEESSVGKKDVNRVWSDTDLIAQAVLFFIAGFETVSSAMSFTLNELTMHPEVQERLAQEIKENELKNGGKFDYSSIQNMTYLDMVVSEVLRLWPPAIVLDRKCLKDYNLGKPNDKAEHDYIIRAGESINIPAWGFHRDPKFFPDPLKFDPERFSEENRHKIQPFTYMPFGFGPRNCIGSRFALCEVKVMLYQLLQHFELSPCEQTCIPVKLDPETFNIRIKGGQWMRLKIRQMLLIIWTVIVVLALTLYYRQKFSRFSKCGVKNLSPVPFLGNLARVTLRIDHFVDDLNRTYNAFPNERFVGKFEFSNPMILIKDLELAKKITVKDFEHFVDHRSFFDENTDNFFFRNLIALKGQEWKDMRSTLSPAFTSSKIRLMVPFMVEVGDQMVMTLKNKIQQSGVGYTDVEGKDLTARYANDVIASCAFGLKVNSHVEQDNEFYKMGKEATTFTFKQVMKMMGFLFSKRLMSILKISLFSQEIKHFFQSIVLDTMEDREKNNIIRPDMIHLLMEAKKGNLEHDNQPVLESDAGFATVEESSVGKKQINRVWSDTDLIAQAVLFFMAGFETVSSAMSFGLHELTVNPEVQEKLAQEIKENEIRNGGKFVYNSIQNMTYMDMVVSEILRMWPPAIALDRVCIKDYNLGRANDKAEKDYIIRKGEGLNIPVWNFHRDPQYFPDPLKFDPERFSEENKHSINPLAYMPFGVGPRNCIGSRFALCEVKVMLYQLLQHFELSPCEKTCIPAVLSKETVNMAIKGGQWMRLKIRQ